MDADLLAFGIDLTHELDRRFGLVPKISMSQVRRHVTPPQWSGTIAPPSLPPHDGLCLHATKLCNLRHT